MLIIYFILFILTKTIYNKKIYIEKNKYYIIDKFPGIGNLYYDIKSDLNWQFNSILIKEKNYKNISNHIIDPFKDTSLYLIPCSNLYSSHAIKSCYDTWENSLLIVISRYTNNNLTININFEETDYNNNKTKIKESILAAIIISSVICCICLTIIIFLSLILIIYCIKIRKQIKNGEVSWNNIFIMNYKKRYQEINIESIENIKWYHRWFPLCFPYKETSFIDENKKPIYPPFTFDSDRIRSDIDIEFEVDRIVRQQRRKEYVEKNGLFTEEFCPANLVLDKMPDFDDNIDPITDENF